MTATEPRVARIRLRVDPTRCVAFGYCSELCPECFDLDEWGYVWLREPEATGELAVHALRAAERCPTGAIRVEIVHDAAAPPSPPSRHGGTVR